jgi:ketosteroid isomerase-like protein
MDFQALLGQFTAAVEAGDGGRLAALFTPDGVYHDTFYGEFNGRAAIKEMLEKRFYGDAERFRWEMYDSVCDGKLGYARWKFSYSSTLPGAAGKRVVAEGMSCFRLEGGLIGRYDEMFNSGIALAQLDFAPERLARLFGRWAAAVREAPHLRQHLDG